MLPSDCKPLQRASAKRKPSENASSLANFAERGVRNTGTRVKRPRPVPDPEEASSDSEKDVDKVSAAIKVNNDEEGNFMGVSVVVWVVTADVLEQGRASKYVKLTRDEKSVVVALMDEFQKTMSQNESVKKLNNLHPRFQNVAKASVNRFREAIAADASAGSDDPVKKQGQPAIVSDDLKDAIKAEVRLLWQ